MADKTGDKNPAEQPNEVSLETPSDFHCPSKNQSKDINRISSERGKQLNSFNEDLSAYKGDRSSVVAAISFNPYTRTVGVATISNNTARHTSRANASRGEKDRVS